MAFLRCDFPAASLGMQASFMVILPDGCDLHTVPVVYLLHGLSDNCTAWSRFTSVEQLARQYNIAIVMPEVHRSFYTDMTHGAHYFSYVTDELPAWCQKTFGFSAAREKNYVMGLSMGGYGAMKCALSYPERYIGAAAFSSVTSIADFRAQFADDGQITAEAVAISGAADIVDEKDDLCALLSRCEKATETPELFLTCGTEDFLYAGNQKWEQTLAQSSLQYTFTEWPGAHTWEFWQQSIEKAFAHYFK